MLPLYSDKDDPSAKKRRPKKRTYIPLVAITVICFFFIVIFVSTKTTSEPAKLARPQSATSATSGPRAFPRVPIPPKLERVMNSPVRSFEFGERAGERGRERYRAEELKIIADFVEPTTTSKATKARTQTPPTPPTPPIHPGVRIEKKPQNSSPDENQIPIQNENENEDEITVVNQLPYLKSINDSPNPCQDEDPTLSPTLTLLSHTTLDRVWLLPPLCSRYKGSITVVLYTNGDPYESYLPKDLCDNMEIITYEKIHADYPVNVLRNIALRSVKTTHFLMADIDFLPSVDLQELVISSLEAQNNLNTKTAIVVPAFETINGGCDSQAECEELLPLVPETFEGMKKCLESEKCRDFQFATNPTGHSTTESDKWLSEGAGLRDITCFKSPRFEPYLVLPNCPKILYDERFSGYGKNKISNIQLLRHLSFEFKVLGQGFLTHVEHRKSASKISWEDNKKKHKAVDRMYDDFMKVVYDGLGNHPKVRLCHLL
ncbi:hypothetical protein TrVE_jg8959 [Triparma verrucosa]|uniref:Glycosyltransferase n=1 Tax=Triparma verrucosa TaxID=1606542 RepID=A0A9W6ZB04_9STRA|nr:hypothetical protein TrVE_jg8959 [Triparma verrucosa]